MSYKNGFNFKEKCDKFYHKGFRRILGWPIFILFSPGKWCVLVTLFITLLLCGVGLYGLFVILLLALLFIFVP